mmetsp:Transcript_4516/g.9445  ORF Transcript_4516/g.9445 Transcript_4516/m.9445 type:complete len:258 (-) Transcript_4516:103-876(-)
MNLLGQLTRRSQDEGVGEGPTRTTIIRGLLAATFDHGHEDGKEKTGRFSGTGLGTRHQIAASHTDWDRIFLHWRRLTVTTQLRVSIQVFPNRLRTVIVNRIRNIFSRYFNGDFVVVVKVDSGRLLVGVIKKTIFQALVGGHISVEPTFVHTGVPTTATSSSSSAIVPATTVIASSPRRSVVGHTSPTRVDLRRRGTSSSKVLAVATSATTAIIVRPATVISSAAAIAIVIILAAVVTTAASSTTLRVSQMRWHIFVS